MYTLHLYQRPLAFRRGRSLSLALALVLGLVALVVARPLIAPAATPEPAINLDFGKLPLSFIPNAGQTDPAVRFQVHDTGGTIFFTPDQVVLTLPTAEQTAPTVVRLRFEDTNPALAVTGADRLPGVVNYFIGDDPAQWRTNLPTYAGVAYRQLYPGIDLRYDGTSGRLKGTYTVAPGADPTRIRWHHGGATGVRLDEATGNLLIALPGAEDRPLVEQAPIAWQEIGGQRVAVAVRYVLSGDGSVGFALGRYDSTRPLVIDPTLVYSTFLGGSGLEQAEGIALDGDGNVYVAGTTHSVDFPTTADSYQPSSGGVEKDVFVAKINAAGSDLVYSTYLSGGDDDEGNGIAVDSAGNAYVVGTTKSTDFPTHGAFQSNCALFVGVCTGDAFVARLSADGSALVYSTYLGGSFPEKGKGIALDSQNNAYVTGMTSSTDFPTQDPLQGPDDGAGDAFVAKLNASGNALVYSTYLGGGATDGGTGVAVDSAGNAYVVGNTNSDDFPTTTGAFDTTCGTDGECDSDAGLHPYTDAFVVKLNASGSALVYSTYLGGGDEDYSHDVAIDSAGNAHVTGRTESGDFPTTTGAFDTTCGTDGDCNPGDGYGKGGDAFVAKLNANGSDLVYSTYLGGSWDDKGHGIAVNSAGNAYVTGDTYSDDFPTQNTIQNYAGETEAFVVKLETDGSSLVYSTYLGGSSGDFGTDVAVDNAGNAFAVGLTSSDDFPTTEGALQTAFGGGVYDAFVVKLGDAAGPPPPPAPPPTPSPNLHGSYKSASQHILRSGEVLTYTVLLHNSGAGDATADVVDELPAEVDYVAGSASDGGVYDPGAGTVTWSDVNVPAGGEVSLTFRVTGTAVEAPTAAVNKATITVDDDSFGRWAAVLLVPDWWPDRDHVPPVVHDLTIDDQDVLTTRDVTLHISATDDEGVIQMYLREWQLATDPIPHWELVQSSGWVPYQTDYPWTLGAESGTHFVGVWVSDDADNTSWLSGYGLDFASLLLPDETVPEGGMVPYMVYYDAGVNVTATLDTTSGDADLYVWYPGSFADPDQKSVNPGTDTDEVSFTTPRAGTYLFLVYGYQASTYNLSITPGGGPRVNGLVVRANVGETGQIASDNQITASGKTELTSEPVLTWSGLDPMIVTPAWAPRFAIYLPVLFK